MDHKTQLRIHDHLEEQHRLKVGVLGGYLKRNLLEPVTSHFFEDTAMSSVTFAQEGVRKGDMLYPWGVEAVVQEDGVGFIMMPEEDVVGVFGEPTPECLQALEAALPDFDISSWETADQWLKSRCEEEQRYGQFGQLVAAGMANRLCLRSFECDPSEGMFTLPKIMSLAREYKHSLTTAQKDAGKRIFYLELGMLEDVMYMGTEACLEPYDADAWLNLLLERDRLESAFAALNCPHELKESLDEFDAQLKRWLPRNLDLSSCARLTELAQIWDRDALDAWWSLYALADREDYIKDLEDVLSGVE